MSDELDLVLIELIHSSKTRLKRIKRLLELLPHDVDYLHQAQERLEQNIIWYQSLIYNEEIKKKRPTIRRTFNNIVYEVKFMWFKVKLIRSKKRE
jgi:hypothetical protein